MSHIKRVTPEYFADLKRTLRWTTSKRAARKHGVSLKTALQVRGSRNYLEYREQCKAQHPETGYSLAEEVLELHQIVFGNVKEYHRPLTAKTAIRQLNFELSKRSEIEKAFQLKKVTF